MKRSPCEDCLVCYVGEYSEVKLDKSGKVIECSNYVAPTKENLEGIRRETNHHA